MNFDNFNTVVEECRAKKPILFGLEHDKILCAEEIEQFEKTVHITLPEKYKEFIMNYGGGYFGYANIYSLDIDSNFYLLKHNNLPFDKYVRIADNGCGDYYVLCIENGKCLDPLFFYDHESDKAIPTEYEDVFEYLVKVGLKKNFP
uniref:SMI1/KNR4 family protein n=1 Tax=Agathobacter sp. TaxID=2021311 RepID=UPI00405700C9